MLTKNEQNVIRIIFHDHRISLREIVEILDLGGVASAAYVVNSLERKKYITKVGSATNKQYRLTPKAMKEVINLSSFPVSDSYYQLNKVNGVDSSGAIGTTGASPHYWISNLGDNGSANTEINTKNIGMFFVANFVRMVSSPAGWKRYGDMLVAVSILTFVAPIFLYTLHQQWIFAFVVIALFELILVLIKKI